MDYRPNIALSVLDPIFTVGLAVLGIAFAFLLIPILNHVTTYHEMHFVVGYGRLQLSRS